eukprot:3398563-Karenia_brevis.AAC.1
MDDLPNLDCLDEQPSPTWITCINDHPRLDYLDGQPSPLGLLGWTTWITWLDDLHQSDASFNS